MPRNDCTLILLASLLLMTWAAPGMAAASTEDILNQLTNAPTTVSPVPATTTTAPGSPPTTLAPAITTQAPTPGPVETQTRPPPPPTAPAPTPTTFPPATLPVRDPSRANNTTAPSTRRPPGDDLKDPMPQAEPMAKPSDRSTYLRGIVGGGIVILVVGVLMVVLQRRVPTNLDRKSSERSLGGPPALQNAESSVMRARTRSFSSVQWSPSTQATRGSSSKSPVRSPSLSHSLYQRHDHDDDDNHDDEDQVNHLTGIDIFDASGSNPSSADSALYARQSFQPSGSWEALEFRSIDSPMEQSW